MSVMRYTWWLFGELGQLIIYICHLYTWCLFEELGQLINIYLSLSLVGRFGHSRSYVILKVLIVNSLGVGSSIWLGLVRFKAL